MPPAIQWLIVRHAASWGQGCTAPTPSGRLREAGPAEGLGHLLAREVIDVAPVHLAGAELAGEALGRGDVLVEMGVVARCDLPVELAEHVLHRAHHVAEVAEAPAVESASSATWTVATETGCASCQWPSLSTSQAKPCVFSSQSRYSPHG